MWGPPRWRADPPPPARPPGRATIGWRVGRPAGRRSLGLKPVAIPAEMQRAQLLARLTDQIAFADEDLVRIPPQRLALGPVAPAHHRPSRAARPERQVL